MLGEVLLKQLTNFEKNNRYVLIPENMLEDLDNVTRYLDESYEYVMSLESK